MPAPSHWIVNSCNDFCDALTDIVGLAQKFNEFIDKFFDLYIAIPFSKYNVDTNTLQYSDITIGGDIFSSPWKDVPKTACGDVYYENGKLKHQGSDLDIQTMQDVVIYNDTGGTGLKLQANGQDIIPYQWCVRYNATTDKFEYITLSGQFVEIAEADGTVRAISQTELEVKINGSWAAYTPPLT